MSHTNIPSEVVKQELAQFETSKNCSLYFLKCSDIRQLISFHLEGPLKTPQHLSSPDGTLDSERPIIMVVEPQKSHDIKRMTIIISEANSSLAITSVWFAIFPLLKWIFI